MQEAIRTFPFLHSIEARDLETSGLRRTTLPPGTPAFAEGEPCRHVAFIVDGAIRVFKTAPDGRQLTLYHVTAGDSCVLMWSCVLADTPYPAQAETATECDVCLLPVEQFHGWMERYESVRRFVYESMARRLATVMLLVDEMVFRRVDERLASLLLQRTSPEEPELAATHEQLALELGTVREVVSRILKSFESTGAVALHRGRVQVLDRNGLRRRFVT